MQHILQQQDVFSNAVLCLCKLYANE